MLRTQQQQRTGLERQVVLHAQSRTFGSDHVHLLKYLTYYSCTPDYLTLPCAAMGNDNIRGEAPVDIS